MKNSYEREYVALDERAEGGWSNEGGHPKENISETDSGHLRIKAAGIEIESKPEKKNGLQSVKIKADNSEFLISDGSVVIAAITSCTNTSNPSVMVAVVPHVLLPGPFQALFYQLIFPSF